MFRLYMYVFKYMYALFIVYTVFSCTSTHRHAHIGVHTHVLYTYPLFCVDYTHMYHMSQYDSLVLSREWGNGLWGLLLGII